MTTTTCSTALPLSLCHSASLWQDQWIQPFSKVTATSRYSLTLRLACSHGLSSVTGHDVLGIHTLDPAFADFVLACQASRLVDKLVDSLFYFRDQSLVSQYE